MNENLRGKKWYDDMTNKVKDYLKYYDYDIDTVIQTIEDSPYVSNYGLANRILGEISNDIHFSQIMNVANSYMVDDTDDDVALVNAMFLEIAHQIIGEIERVEMPISEIFRLGLWEDVCDEKGWDYFILNEGRIDLSEVVEFNKDLLGER